MEALLYAEVYAVCILVISLLLFWTIKNNEQTSADRWFKVVLICFFLNFVSNFLFKLQTGGFILQNHFLFWGYLFKTAYYLTLDTGIFAWCGYCDTEEGSGIFQRRKTLHLLCIPLLVPILLAFYNLYHHVLFTVDPDGEYTRLFMFHFNMLYLLAGCGIMSCRLLMRARREADPQRRGHMNLTASFPLCILAAWILCFIGESIPVICVCIMFELLCLYIGSSKNQISLDKLTQVNNRQNLMGFMRYKLDHSLNPLHLLLIDLDLFKQINDTYGHLEGDNALVQVSGALKRACGDFKRRPYIARYGGDEFIVVAEVSDEEVEDLIGRINRSIDQANQQGKPYTLQLSIGHGKWEPGMGFKELLAAADEELYIIKREKKAARAQQAG